MKKTKAKRWQKLSSQTIVDYGGLKLNEDTVVLPNGKQTTYIRRDPEEADAVIIIALNNNKQILLQKEYNYPPDTIMWQLPGGSMHNGENIIDAANRELSEESGYMAKKSEVIGFFYPNNRSSGRKQHILVCTNLIKRSLKPDDDEFIDSYWINISDLHKYIQEGEFTNINLLAALNVWFERQRYNHESTDSIS